MRIIEIETLDNGAHNNQTINGIIPVPDGWAVIPDDMECKNFPFGKVEVEVVNGVATATKWTPGAVPDPEPEPAPEPTQLDRVEAQAAYTAMMTGTLLEV